MVNLIKLLKSDIEIVKVNHIFLIHKILFENGIRKDIRLFCRVTFKDS